MVDENKDNSSSEEEGSENEDEESVALDSDEEVRNKYIPN